MGCGSDMVSGARQFAAIMEREYRDVEIEDQVQTRLVNPSISSSLTQSPQSNSRCHYYKPVRQGPSTVDRRKAHHPRWVRVTLSLL